MASKKQSEQRFLSRAANQALRTSFRGHGGPFGAVIVDRRGRILATASNTVLQKKDPTCHAEINAIRRACAKRRSPFLEGCRIFSTTEPCPMCFSAIHWARAAEIVYSTTINDVKKLGFNELSISNVAMKQKGKSSLQVRRVENKACRQLLMAWISNPLRCTY